MSYQHYEKRFDKSSAYGLAKAAYSTANFVKDMVNIEYKTHMLDPIGPLPIDSTGAVMELVAESNGAAYFPGISQGDGNDQRIGDSIKLQRCVFRGTLVKHSSATVSLVRVILFRGKAEDGKVYTVGDILGTGAAGAHTVYSSKDEDNKYNTKILYDELFILDSVKSQYVEFNWNKELNWHTRYVAASNVIAEGGLNLLMFSTEAVNAPVLNGCFKISYTDD